MMIDQVHPTVKAENMTPHFRNMLREDNPEWSIPEILHWYWDSQINLPHYDGEAVGNLDPAAPGAETIARMFHHVKTGHACLSILKTRFIY